MAASIGNLAIQISGNAAGLSAALSQARSEVGSFASQATAVFSGMAAFSGASSLMSTLGSIGRSALELAADFQDAQVSFEVMTGSAETGTALLKQIQQMAADTPYASPELIQSARTLAGYGLELKNILPALREIGEVTAGAGGGTEKLQRITLAFGQVIAKGRLMAQDLNQFTEAGVAVQDFAAVMGVTVGEFRDLMEQGRVGSDVVVKAFNRMTGEGGRFYGLMDKISKNARGQFNAIRENFNLGLQEIGLAALEGLNDAGVFNLGRDLAEQLKAAGPAVRQWVQEFVRDLPNVAEQFGRTAGAIADKFAEAGAEIGDNLVKPLLEAARWVDRQTGGRWLWEDAQDGLSMLSLDLFGSTEQARRMKEEMLAAAKAASHNPAAWDGMAAALDARIKALRAGGRTAGWGNSLKNAAIDIRPPDPNSAAAALNAAMDGVFKAMTGQGGQIEIELKLTPATQEMVSQLKKMQLEGFTPFEQFQTDAGRLLEAAKANAITERQFGEGGLQAFEKLEKEFGKNFEVKLSGGFGKGTAEAESIINRALSQPPRETMERRLLKVLEEAKRQAAERLRLAKEMSEALQGLNAKLDSGGL